MVVVENWLEGWVVKLCTKVVEIFMGEDLKTDGGLRNI